MPMRPFTVSPCDPERTFFRVLIGETPNAADFYHDEASGKVAGLDEVPNWAEVRGFSVRATLPQMKRLAHHLGRSHIAEIRLNGEDGSAFARFSRKGACGKRRSGTRYGRGRQVTFELINQKTANTFGDYDSEREALVAYEKVQAQNAALAEELVLVKFDDSGEAVASHKPAELFAH